MTRPHTWDPASVPPLGPVPAVATTQGAFAYEDCDVAPGMTLSEWRAAGDEPRRRGPLRRLLRRR
jgi:hypothetical protein